ncbi:MAG TPA: hypothetical protein VES62_18550, partial [Thermoleophilaceae bacterium]|nr:hypothetical protein [Thermoleophilaceae bacterium]
VRTLPAIALLLGLAACGGSDEKADAQQTVRDFVQATNERDGERLCGELVTQQFKEQATGATGERVDRICERQLELTRGLKLDLLGVGRTKIDGERATVSTRLDIDGVTAPRIFALEKEDGSWKLASGSSE